MTNSTDSTVPPLTPELLKALSKQIRAQTDQLLIQEKNEADLLQAELTKDES